jgi:hypothetical protein
MKYAHIDNNGQVLGWYDSEIHELIPTPNKEFTEAEYHELRETKHNTIFPDGSTGLVDYRELDEIAAHTRAIRNALLAETDWWMLPDNTVTDEQVSYRQALRDITAQDGFPTEILWPSKP